MSMESIATTVHAAPSLQDQTVSTKSTNVTRHRAKTVPLALSRTTNMSVIAHTDTKGNNAKSSSIGALKTLAKMQPHVCNRRTSFDATVPLVGLEKCAT